MTVLKYLPEATVISAFFPMGVFMGYIMQYHFVGLINKNQNIQIILKFSQWWPWVVGSGTAILTGILLFVIKIRSRQYRYEHLYFVNFGMLLFFIAGILFITTYIPTIPIYMSFAAHGICYIAALSYINVRMGKTKFRFLRLSIPLAFYIFAAAIGATVVYSQISIVNYNSPTAPINDVIGILLITSSLWTIGCILILEYNLKYSKLNYKTSLDEDINRENKSFTIFEQKYFVITSKNRNVAPPPQLTIKKSNTRRLFFFTFTFISKITSIMYFYGPFIYIHHFMSFTSRNIDLFSINWFGFVGAFISTILLLPLKYKVQHNIGILSKLTYMVILLIIFSNEYLLRRDIAVVMWFLFMTLGFAYPNCDVNILSYTNLKYTEIVLTLGYVILNITVGVVQYTTIRNPSTIINFDSLFELVYNHVLAFLLVMIVLLILGMIIMPKRDLKSLLELQNYINTLNEQHEPQNNVSNTTVNTSIPYPFSIYGQSGSDQHNIQQPSVWHEIMQQPPTYEDSTVQRAEQQPPTYSSIAHGENMNTPPR